MDLCRRCRFPRNRRTEISVVRSVTALTDRINGIYVRHRQVFRGRFLKHGTIYPRYWLRVFRSDALRWIQNELVDQHFYVSGETNRLEFEVIEDNVKERDITFWLSKQLRFAERAAIEEVVRLQQVSFRR